MTRPAVPSLPDTDPRDPSTWARDGLLLSLVVAALLLPWLGATELSGTDEARYTQVAREMRLAGRWFSPVLNGEQYWEKPALFFDLLQVPQLLSGRVTPVGSRLMILPFAIASVLATWATGRMLAGRRAGLLAAAILATSSLFAELGARAVLDTPMLAFITLSLACHVAATRAGRSPGRWHFAAAAAMGVGCLFKGPVAILLPGAVMAADAVARQGLSAARTPRLLWMPLVALLVLGIWVVPMAMIHGSDFVEHALGKHVVDRSVGAAAPHAKSALFYLPRLLTTLFPWSLVLPAAFAAWSRAGPGLTGRADPRDSLRFARIWALAIPLVLTLIASKRSQYLLPALPGAALWLALWLDSRWREGGSFLPGEARALRIAGLVLAALAPAVALALPILYGLAEFRATWGLQGTEVPSAVWAAFEGPVAIAIGGGSALLLVAGAIILERPAPRRIFIGLVALGIGTIVLRQGIADPYIDRGARPNEFGAELASFLAAGGDVDFYGMRLDGAYLLHSGATHLDHLDSPAEVVAHLAGEGPRAVLAKRRYLRRDVLPGLAPPPAVILRHGGGRGEVVLIGNRAAESLARDDPGPPER